MWRLVRASSAVIQRSSAASAVGCGCPCKAAQRKTRAEGSQTPPLARATVWCRPPARQRVYFPPRRAPLSARDEHLEQQMDAWVARQLDNAPPLGERQKALIRAAFAEFRQSGPAAELVIRRALTAGKWGYRWLALGAVAGSGTSVARKRRPDRSSVAVSVE